MPNKNNKTNIIDFLSREFNIADNGKKAIQIIKAKKIPNKKNNFKNISSLLSEVLAFLPKEEREALKDKDEIAAGKWFNLHKEAKEVVCGHLKNDVGKKELKKFEKFLSIAATNNFLSTKRIAFTAAVAASFILSIGLVYYQPARVENYVNFIDNNFFAFLREQEKDLSDEKIDNFRQNKHSALAVAAAKAVYIVKNKSDFHDGDIIKVSENELFGKIAYKLKVNESFDKNKIAPPAVAKAVAVKENKIFSYFKKIINILELKQERLSLAMQEKLLNLISD
ncbi:MAG: hypothetical protein U9M94_00025 [Patescibacteria group bacterium]|nr:hypothetical protein [Patescibacteria group bacterium]